MTNITHKPKLFEILNNFKEFKESWNQKFKSPLFEEIRDSVASSQ